MQSKKKASAPSYQLDGTRVSAPAREAATIIPLERKRRPTAKEQQGACFRLGSLCGLLLSLIVFVAIMWLWAIPTVDSAVATAQHAYETTAGLHA
ncbi:hypothetical protein [Paratractidigestivibacter sp.]|uniref:hypothetical protein n=1 Tax=Paratractidigestivibacter sp. TaxID=2847316 RepID=UPI002AC975BF|nr:hypothetical protein [Paratractidigestivibacter sp.]